MVPGRLLLLVSDRSLRVEIERALLNCASIVMPSHSHSIEDCFRDGKYYAVVLTFEFALKYQSELLHMAERSSVPIERILIYQQSEWESLSPLVERGIVTRLVPHFWDIQTMVDLLLRLCEREEIEFSMHHQQVTGNHNASESDLKKRILELEMQNRRLSALATTDGLTGLANRRELNDVLSKEISRARRFNQPLSFVMCDVDHFKNYNDNFGHPAGDDVLQTIAALMRSRLRASDLAARYGGEEFGMVLPMTTKESAIRVADSLRKRIEEHRFAHQTEQPNGNLTVSMGVAAIGEDGDTAAAVIDAADKALYLAKQTGRNKVLGYHAPEKPSEDTPAK